MKKVLAWLLVLSLTVVISIGVTLAYLTDTDEDVNVMTLGNVMIDQLEYERADVETANDNAQVQEFHNNKPLYPAVTDNGFDYTPGATVVDWKQIGKDGYTTQIWDPEKINNELDKMVFVKNKGSYDAYVRTVFAFEAGNYGTATELLEAIHMNLNETDFHWTWMETPVEIPNAEGTENTKYFIAVATYDHILAPGALSEISLSQIALDKSATNEDVEAFGETYQILVKTQAIQADGFRNELLPEHENAQTALDAGFGAVQNALPFENDNPYRGTDLRTALHHYQGDPSNVITQKITKVVFGRNKDYPEIIDNYKATLVDVGQDVKINIYYVGDSGTYNVYFLSDSPIYAPEDSASLFAGMTALTEVDTSNLDMSRTNTMRRMFSGDTNLRTVNAGNWDTSNVTSMNGLFMNCQSLQELDVSGWDTSKVTDMYAMFYACRSLPTLDVSEWNVGNVTNMEFTFSGCEQFTTLNVADWDVSEVTSFDAFLQSVRKADTMKLEYLDVSKWDTGKCLNYDRMFFWCTQLKTLDMSSWNSENVKDMGSMFFNCSSLTTLYVSERWSTASLTYSAGMFSGCSKLVGGNGTAFAVAKVADGSYARIDTTETPGYLTYKAVTN